MEKEYDSAVKKPSDINEHLPTLRSLAREAKSVAEFGVRGVVSTWALLLGLMEAGGTVMYSVDINTAPGIENAISLARTNGIDMRFIQADSASVNLPTPVDLLFIDTWHVYAHLKRELAFHHGRVNKYIVMHDTEVDKERGESLRMHANVDLQSRRSGYPVDEIKCGLGRAISEFLATHGDEWELYKHFPNNNGLTVLKKNGQHSVQ
jgi:cephalosporin hydroxylase